MSLSIAALDKDAGTRVSALDKDAGTRVSALDKDAGTRVSALDKDAGTRVSALDKDAGTRVPDNIQQQVPPAEKKAKAKAKAKHSSKKESVGASEEDDILFHLGLVSASKKNEDVRALVRFPPWCGDSGDNLSVLRTHIGPTFQSYVVKVYERCERKGHHGRESGLSKFAACSCLLAQTAHNLEVALSPGSLPPLWPQEDPANVTDEGTLEDSLAWLTNPVTSHKFSFAHLTAEEVDMLLHTLILWKDMSQAMAVAAAQRARISDAARGAQIPSAAQRARIVDAARGVQPPVASRASWHTLLSDTITLVQTFQGSKSKKKAKRSTHETKFSSAGSNGTDVVATSATVETGKSRRKQEEEDMKQLTNDLLRVALYITCVVFPRLLPVSVDKDPTRVPERHITFRELVHATTRVSPALPVCAHRLINALIVASRNTRMALSLFSANGAVIGELLATGVSDEGVRTALLHHETMKSEPVLPAVLSLLAEEEDEDEENHTSAAGSFDVEAATALVALEPVLKRFARVLSTLKKIDESGEGGGEKEKEDASVATLTSAIREQWNRFSMDTWKALYASSRLRSLSLNIRSICASVCIYGILSVQLQEVVEILVRDD